MTTLRFANTTDGWVAGQALYATHDSGASWQHVAVGPAHSVITSLATGGGMVYASLHGCPSPDGNHCSNTTKVYRAKIGSNRWSSASATLNGPGTGLVVHGDDWYLAVAGGIHHGHGTGHPVKLANPCPQYKNLAEIPTLAVADPQHLDAMCVGSGAGGSAPYQLYGTSDGARHWHKAGPERREASQLGGLADNGHGVLLAATASGGSEILRSTNDGSTLPNAAITTPTGGIPWSDLGFTTSTRAIVVLQKTALYLSHNASRSWQPMHF